MITKEKIDIYIQYDGDIDSWARSGSKKEKIIMTDNDWYIIDAFIQDFLLVKKGLSSKEFKNSLDERLKENLENIETISMFRNIVDKLL